MDTFGEDYINEHYIDKIKSILKHYSNDVEAIQFNIDMLEEEYDEGLSNDSIKYESWEKKDMFNELIKKAKEELNEENVPFSNNLRGGKRKSMRKRTKRKHTKRKHTKRKHTKRKHTKRKYTYKKRTYKSV
jgi:hypothetical protein